ncbi:hypothetical protein GCM10009647_077220 [Streptomyces sanglieri]
MVPSCSLEPARQFHAREKQLRVPRERAEHLGSGDLRYHDTTRRVPVRRCLVVFEPVAGDDGW